MADRTGDILLGLVDHPVELVEGRPLVLLIHGLTGSEDSAYMLDAARHLLDGGYSVLRLNLRGCGPSRPNCREHYHVGRTADFRGMVSQLPEHLIDNGVVEAPICAPVDLSRTCKHMMRTRNWLHHTYPLNHMKAEALAPGALTTPEEREIIKAARSVWEYDDRFISPRCGFRRGEDYELCSPLAFMTEIRVPTMVIASCDDPWIPVEYYREFNWSDNPSLVPLLPPTGGHIGFHADDSARPWCDLAVEKFIDRLATIEA